VEKKIIEGIKILSRKSFYLRNLSFSKNFPNNSFIQRKKNCPNFHTLKCPPTHRYPFQVKTTRFLSSTCSLDEVILQIDEKIGLYMKIILPPTPPTHIIRQLIGLIKTHIPPIHHDPRLLRGKWVREEKLLEKSLFWRFFKEKFKLRAKKLIILKVSTAISLSDSWST